MNKKFYVLPILAWAFCFLTPLSSQTPIASFANWKDNKKAAYTIIHDDYSDYVTGIYQYADPIATARGIKLCFGAITSACGPTEWTKAITMMSHGHECVNHSHNHFCGGSASQCSGLTTYGPANFATELDLSTQLIETNTGVRPRFFIHPYDASSGAILNYLTSIGYLGSRAGSQLISNPSSFTNFMNLNYYVYDGTATALASLNTAINSAITSGSYVIREFHGIADGSWAAMTVANYTSHLDYVKTKITDGSLWSATATEAITYKMQRDAFGPAVAYNSTANTVTVSFSALKAIDPSVLRTPVTLNVNVAGFTPAILSASQNGSAVTYTRVGDILSFNVYPHLGSVVLNVGIGTPPPVNVTDLVATPQTNAMLLGWTNPTTAFDEVMIVAKASTGFTTIPSGTTYTANANFTGAGTAFEGGKVVYRGIGTGMTVTGLTAGTTYFFRVYTRSGTAWSTGVQISAIPLATPTANITNLIATPQPNAMLLGWTNPTTAFNEVMIVAKANTGFTATPSGTAFTANANFTGISTAFNGGKVVYRGTGTSMTVTGLTAGTTYFFRVYTRSGTVWSTGVEVSAIPTAPAPPANITNLISTPQPNAMLLGWTNPTTAFNEVMIVVKANTGFTTIPSGTTFTANANFTGAGTAFEGGKVVYRGTGTSMTVTGLTAGTTYFFRVYTRSGTAWSTGIEVSAIPTAPTPTPNITNLIATPQTNAMLLGWTNPTTAFDEVMIVAKAATGFTTIPSGTTYTANASFTGAGTAFEGGKVVYRGAGTSMTVTDLTGGTTYFFRVYTRSGTAWSTGVQVSDLPIAAPTPDNVINLTATPQTNAALVSWTNPTSAFDEVLVVAKELTGFTTTPVGTTYNSDSNFSGTGSAFEGGKVVYRGIGTTVTVTNLIAGRTYFFRAYTRLGTVWSSGVQVSAVPTGTVPPSCTANGKLIHKVWNTITLNNYDISDLTTDARYPNSPTSVDTLTQFTTFSTVSFFGDRVLGYIAPQVTGSYTFWVAGADDVQLYLSTDESVANKRLICTIPDYSSLGEFTRYPTQQSAAINLLAGQFYYVELLHIQSEGEAHFEVQWQTPTNATRSPIPSANLSSRTCNAATPLLLATAQTATFVGRLNGDKGILNWVTKSADENDYFILEKADEKTGNFKQLDVINAQGRDKSLQAFSYVDVNMNDGDNFYRLNTIAQNSTQGIGSGQYSQIVNIKYDRPDAYAIFPNPAEDYFSIDLSLANGKSVEIAVVSLLGKVIKTERIATPSVLHRFELGDLESGQYFIRVQPQGKRMVMKKLMIMR